MEETIYQQAWTQAYTTAMLSEHMADKATEWANAIAWNAVQNFDHSKMQAAITAKRDATDTLMGEGEGE